MNDIDCWNSVNPADLWVTDKLLLAKRLGYLCGPAGMPPPHEDLYIVRPCVNYRMMSRGAKVMRLSPTNHDQVPDGYFWCEMFSGSHMSYDYRYGQQVLAVEGFREDPMRLDRFSKWKKVEDIIYCVPNLLLPIIKKYSSVNLEVIDNKVIEVHFRYNDDFYGHDSKEIVPVWKDQFYHSECGDRLGFILK